MTKSNLWSTRKGLTSRRSTQRRRFLTGLAFLSIFLGTGCERGSISNDQGNPDKPGVVGAQTTKCASDLAPVCGTDGVSYRNSCAATFLGHTEIASQGICPGKPVDPDGWTSVNSDTLVSIDVPIRCGTPDPIKDPPILDPADPVDPVIPSNPLNGTCKDKFPEGIAIKCASDLDPVCGCDGNTYRNGCYAMGVGHVYVKSKGACPGKPYVEE